MGPTDTSSAAGSAHLASVSATAAVSATASVSVSATAAARVATSELSADLCCGGEASAAPRPPP